MDNYKDRLATFINWPNNYNTFVQKLAIMGQYSTDSSELETRCIYCGQVLTEWKTTDIPLLEHYKRNNKCIIFKLHTVKSRTIISELLENRDNNNDIVSNSKNINETVNYKDLKKSIIMEMDPNDLNRDLLRKDLIKIKNNIKRESIANNNLSADYLCNKFIRLNLSRDKSYFACLICGKTKLEHKCTYKTVQRVNNDIDFNVAQFYIKYLNGDYLDTINYIINDKNILSTNIKNLVFESKDLLAYLMSKVNFTVFDNLETFLKNGSEVLFSEIENEIKRRENLAILTISKD